MEFSNENVINAVHNEPSLWDPNVNANEEEKKWHGNEFLMHLESKLVGSTQVISIIHLLHRQPS